MSIFSTHPIKINIVKGNVIEKLIVFTGSVPKDVEKELRAIENKASFSESVIKKFYGNGWREKLGIDVIKGGLDSSDQADIEQTKDLQIPPDEPISDMEINMDELEDLFLEIEGNHTTVKRDMKSSNITFVIEDIGAYPEDNFFELKKKIFLVSGIPIYRQHLWMESKGIVRTINYNVYSGNNLLSVNINDIQKATSNIEGIPVFQDVYNQRDLLKIEDMDAFDVLENYYYKYGNTTYNLVDIHDFIDPSKQAHKSLINDKNKVDIVYYGFVVLYWPILSRGAFEDYLKNEDSIQKFYPTLYPDVLKLAKAYSMEKKILDTQYEIFGTPKIKPIQDKLESAITYAIINVFTSTDISIKNISLRNLFDRFKLSPEINMCRCHIEHNNKIYMLEKYFEKTRHSTEKIPLNSIMFRIYPVPGSLQYINFILTQNGNYMTRSKWREEKYYTFEAILKIISRSVNLLIKRINSFGSDIIVRGKNIEFMTNRNAKLSEINLSVLYKHVVTRDGFANIKERVKDYNTANFIENRSDEGSFMELYFKKGMYKFDPSHIEKYTDVSNYYEHLTNGDIRSKWQNLFEQRHITKIQHRFSDIKIETTGLKEKEFPLYYRLLVTLFYLFEKQFTTSVKRDETVVKKLKNLKEQDPLLYDFKKIYNSKEIFSKICQNPHQPTLMNKNQFNKLSNDAKKNTVKYWNFTNNTPAYYSCPSTKYKYVKFIINKHPHDFCIPCCFKKNIPADKNNPKRIIHDICLSKHTYKKEKTVLTKGSRYIMTYGKDVEEGRLSKLPEDTLESLFYDKYSDKYSGIDPECMTSDGFYLYGVAQHTPSISNIGFLFCLSHALGIDIKSMILKIIVKLKENQSDFYTLLHGKITDYFPSLNELVNALTLISADKTINFIDTSVPWNDLFIHMSNKFYNINVVVFTHFKKIKLDLPLNLVDYTKFSDPSKKNIIVLNKRNKFYPIYLLNVEVFNKTGIIDHKLFSQDSSIIITINALIKKYFATYKHPIGVPYENLDLYVMEKFITNSQYMVVKMFINSMDLCNGLLVTRGKRNDKLFYTDTRDPKELIYIPIHDSHYSSEYLDFHPFYRKDYNLSIHTLNKFLLNYNEWVISQSKESDSNILYPIISHDRWIKLKNVMGFKCNDLNFYFNDINLQAALKIKKSSVDTLLYDPDTINKIIFEQPSPVNDTLHKNIGSNYHEYFGYKLFLGELNEYFLRHRDSNKRARLKKVLSGNIRETLSTTLSQINKVVEQKSDLKKIKAYIAKYINDHQDKTRLLNDIFKERYQFDDIELNRIRNMKPGVIKQEIYKISKKIIHISEKKIDTFPNIYQTCVRKPDVDYCFGSKLILSKKNFNNYVDIFSSDVQNPLKSNIIFNSIISDSVINYFRFSKFPREHIFVTDITD